MNIQDFISKEFPYLNETQTALARHVLTAYQNAQMKPRTCDDILRAAAEANGTTVKAILSPSRKREIVWARNMVCGELRRKGITLVEIGQAVGNRDHSTVIHACERDTELSQTQPAYRKYRLKMQENLTI